MNSNDDANPDFNEIVKNLINHHDTEIEKLKFECQEYKSLSAVLTTEKSKLQNKILDLEDQNKKLHQELANIKKIFQLQLESKNREIESKNRELISKSQELELKKDELVQERSKLDDEVNKLFLKPMMSDKSVETDCFLSDFFIDDLKPLAPVFEKYEVSDSKSELIKFQELTQISDIESLNSEDEYRLYEDSYKIYSQDPINVEASESNLKPEIMEKSHPQLEVESSPEEVKNTEIQGNNNPPELSNESDIHVNFETTLTLDDDLSDSELTPTSPFLKRTKHSVPVSMPVTPILKNEYTPKCSRSLSRVQFSHEEYSDGSANKIIKSKSCLSNDRSKGLNRKRLNFGAKTTESPLINGKGESNSEAEREESKENENNNKQEVENVNLNTSQLNSPSFLKNPRIGKRGRQMIEAIASQKNKTSS